MHTHFPRYTVNYSSGTAFDSADLPCTEPNPEHHIEIYTQTTPPPRFFRHFIMLYDFRPSSWKMTIILLQQLAIKRLAEYVEWHVKEPQWCTQWELLTETHTGLYLPYTHTNTERRNKRAGLWPGHVTNGPLEGVQKNISQSKLMPFKCTQLPLAGQLSELKEYLMTVCLALT